jgi:hypothetical protein
MAQTKSKLSEVLNEIAVDEGFLLAESTAKIPAAAKSVALEATGGNLIESGLKNGDILVIENSTAAEKEVTFAAGESPPSLRKGEGTSVVKLPEKTQTVIVLETARHFDKSGNLALTLSAGTTGKIAVLRFKKQ